MKTTPTIISIRIPIDLVEKVDEEASTTDRSRNYIIVQTLRERYENNGKKPATRKKPTQKETEA